MFFSPNPYISLYKFSILEAMWSPSDNFFMAPSIKPSMCLKMRWVPFNEDLFFGNKNKFAQG